MGGAERSVRRVAAWAVRACNGSAKMPSCTLRIQMELEPEVYIFSRYTPAKPESVAAASAATTPTVGDAPVGAFADLASCD